MHLPALLLGPARHAPTLRKSIGLDSQGLSSLVTFSVGSSTHLEDDLGVGGWTAVPREPLLAGPCLP